jgi:hypothetical protein
VGSYGSALGGVVSLIGMYGLLVWFACGAFASHVASEKDRCGFCWFLWGVVFGPMALLAVVGLPDKSKPRGIDAVSPKTHVLCPECDEPVKNEARKCKHCGSGLRPQVT